MAGSIAQCGRERVLSRVRSERVSRSLALKLVSLAEILHRRDVGAGVQPPRRERVRAL